MLLEVFSTGRLLRLASLVASSTARRWRRLANAGFLLGASHRLREGASCHVPRRAVICRWIGGLAGQEEIHLALAGWARVPTGTKPLGHNGLSRNGYGTREPRPSCSFSLLTCASVTVSLAYAFVT